MLSNYIRWWNILFKVYLVKILGFWGCGNDVWDFFVCFFLGGGGWNAWSFTFVQITHTSVNTKLWILKCLTLEHHTHSYHTCLKYELSILKCLLPKTLRDAILLQSWRFCIVFFQQHVFFVDIYFNLLKNIFDISFIACERLCLEKLFCLVIEKQIHSFYGGPRVKIQQSESPLHWIINEEIRLMLLCEKKSIWY